jgi:SnoaL-like domain
MESSDEIRNLLATYCERIDRGDFAGVGDLFGKGGLADEHGNVFATGSEAVADVFARQVIRYDDGTPSTKHLVVNTVFESLDTPLRPIITGRYRDTFRRDTEGSWRFAERRFFVDLAGDLSLHLRPEFIP